MDRFLVRRDSAPVASGETPSSTSSLPSTSPRESQAPDSIEDEVSLPPPEMQNRGELVQQSGTRRGVRVRTFQPHWVKTFPWLEYEASKNAVLCRICKLAFQQKCVTFSSKVQLSFIETGFCGWKNGLERFRKHERSECHRESVFKTRALTSGLTVSTQMSSAHNKAKLENREALLKILTTLRHLATQGQAIRGHVDASSNFTTVLKLRCHDSPLLKRWMERTSYKWCSHEICNEMLAIMSHHVTRSLVSRIVQAKHYAVMVDETSDISIQEQVSICFRIVTEDLEVEELFLGFHSTTDTRAETIYRIILDILCRFDLPVSDCRGQCFDGAQNMAGALTGVQARMRSTEPRALFVHCMAHSLSLTVQHFIKHVEGSREALITAQNLLTFMRESPKRYAIFKALQSQSGEGPSSGLRPFCPTRWTVRCHSLSSILSHYVEIAEALVEIADSSQQFESRSKAKGFVNVMAKFDFFFHLSVLCKVFGYVDTVNTALQSPSLPFMQAASMISALIEMLLGLRGQFQSFWDEVTSKSKSLSIRQPKLPRKRTFPARLDDAANRDVCPFNCPEDLYRQVFHQVVDTVVQCIRGRFQSDALDLMGKAEKFLSGAEPGFDELREHFGDDVDERQLVLHRDMLLNFLGRRGEKNTVSVASVVESLKQDHGGLKAMFPELVTFLRQLLTVPVSTASAERSFSGLRRLKTYLRSTLTQQRLNHLAILHVHAEVANEVVDLDAIADEFISRKDIRKATFAMSPLT